MTIHFPTHVVSTPCARRTFRMVLPRRDDVYGTRHGAVIMEATYEGDVSVYTVVRPFPGNGKRLMPAWTDSHPFVRRSVATTKIR